MHLPQLFLASLIWLRFFDQQKAGQTQRSSGGVTTPHGQFLQTALVAALSRHDQWRQQRDTRHAKPAKQNSLGELEQKAIQEIEELRKLEDTMDTIAKSRDGDSPEKRDWQMKQMAVMMNGYSQNQRTHRQDRKTKEIRHYLSKSINTYSPPESPESEDGSDAEQNERDEKDDSEGDTEEEENIDSADVKTRGVKRQKIRKTEWAGPDHFSRHANDSVHSGGSGDNSKTQNGTKQTRRERHAEILTVLAEPNDANDVDYEDDDDDDGSDYDDEDDDNFEESLLNRDDDNDDDEVGEVAEVVQYLKNRDDSPREGVRIVPVSAKRMRHNKHGHINYIPIREVHSHGRDSRPQVLQLPPSLIDVLHKAQHHKKKSKPAIKIIRVEENAPTSAPTTRAPAPAAAPAAPPPMAPPWAPGPPWARGG